MDRDAGSWSEPHRLGVAVNSGTGEWHASVARDGSLYFASSERDGQGGADIYMVADPKDATSGAMNLGAPINGPFHEWDPYIDPDGGYLLLKSDRPGGFGGMDMYISFPDSGGWTEPVNLGSPINTPLDEDSGDIILDGESLVFARQDGWRSMDLFWTRFDPESYRR